MEKRHLLAHPAEATTESSPSTGVSPPKGGRTYVVKFALLLTVTIPGPYWGGVGWCAALGPRKTAALFFPNVDGVYIPVRRPLAFRP